MRFAHVATMLQPVLDTSAQQDAICLPAFWHTLCVPAIYVGSTRAGHHQRIPCFQHSDNDLPSILKPGQGSWQMLMCLMSKRCAHEADESHVGLSKRLHTA